MKSLVKSKMPLGCGGLLLSRKQGESVRIFDPNDGSFVPITISLAKTQGNRSTWHIQADRRLAIVRSELVPTVATVQADPTDDPEAVAS